MAKIADRNNLKAERILWAHGVREFHYRKDGLAWWVRPWQQERVEGGCPGSCSHHADHEAERVRNWGLSHRDLSAS